MKSEISGEAGEEDLHRFELEASVGGGGEVEEDQGEEERGIQSQVRRFVQERFLPRAAALFAEERFPIDLVPELAALGLLGASLSGYGCAGLSKVQYGLVLQELEYGDSGLRRSNTEICPSNRTPAPDTSGLQWATHARLIAWRVAKLSVQSKTTSAPRTSW